MAKTPAERMAMMRARRKAGEVWEPQPCGTPAAAFRHYKRSEKPCDACREALRQRRLDKKRVEPDD